MVGDRVNEALAADEIAREWDPTRRDLEAEATRALAPGPPGTGTTGGPGRGAGSGAGPVVAPPGGRAERHVVRDPAGLDAAVAEIRAALDELGSVEVTWRAPGPPGDA